MVLMTCRIGYMIGLEYDMSDCHIWAPLQWFVPRRGAKAVSQSGRSGACGSGLGLGNCDSLARTRLRVGKGRVRVRVRVRVRTIFRVRVRVRKL